MESIKRMQMYTTSKCQLRCDFCPRSVGTDLPGIYMDMEEFIKYAEKCLDDGITEFELSPLIGDPLLDQHLAERIKWLQARPEVTLIFIFTNLIGLSKDFLRSISFCDKFEFKLSIYGFDRETYKKRTNKDLYDKFCEKLQDLVDFTALNPVEYKISEVVIRVPGEYDVWDPKLTKSKVMNQLYKGVITKVIEEGTIVGDGEDVSWVESLIHVEESIHDNKPEPNVHGRVGVCEYLLEDNGIWPGGDVGLCTCWFDVNKKMILGNINEKSIEEMYGKGSLFETIQEEQEKGLYRSLCKHCDWGTKPGQS